MENGVTRCLNVFNGPLPKSSVRRFKSRINLMRKMIHLKHAFERGRKEGDIVDNNNNTKNEREQDEEEAISPKKNVFEDISESIASKTLVQLVEECKKDDEEEAKAITSDKDLKKIFQKAVGKVINMNRLSMSIKSKGEHEDDEMKIPKKKDLNKKFKSAIKKLHLLGAVFKFDNGNNAMVFWIRQLF